MFPADLIGGLANYPGFKQMILGHHFCMGFVLKICDYCKQLIVGSRNREV